MGWRRMKIRNGFVSNSSSSSFVIDDKNCDIDEVELFMEKLSEFYKENFESDYHNPDSYSVDKISKQDIDDEYSSYNDDDLNKIVIHETSDNSFPSSYEDLICEKFDCRRIYHG